MGHHHPHSGIHLGNMSSLFICYTLSVDEMRAFLHFRHASKAYQKCYQ
jgi:hypothetical protein